MTPSVIAMSSSIVLHGPSGMWVYSAVLVRHAWAAVEEGEVSLEVDELIDVIMKDGGWWWGRIGGRVVDDYVWIYDWKKGGEGWWKGNGMRHGWFPATYIGMVADDVRMDRVLRQSSGSGMSGRGALAPVVQTWWAWNLAGTSSASSSASSNTCRNASSSEPSEPAGWPEWSVVASGIAASCATHTAPADSLPRSVLAAEIAAPRACSEVRRTSDDSQVDSQSMDHSQIMEDEVFDEASVWCLLDLHIIEFWAMFAQHPLTVVFHSPGGGGDFPFEPVMSWDGTVVSNRHIREMAKAEFHRGMSSDDWLNSRWVRGFNLLKNVCGSGRIGPTLNTVYRKAQWMEAMVGVTYALMRRSAHMAALDCYVTVVPAVLLKRAEAKAETMWGIMNRLGIDVMGNGYSTVKKPYLGSLVLARL